MPCALPMQGVFNFDQLSMREDLPKTLTDKPFKHPKVSVAPLISRQCTEEPLEDYLIEEPPPKCA